MVCRAYFGDQTERFRRPAVAVGNHLFSDTPISPGICAADTDIGLLPRFSGNNVRGLSAYATKMGRSLVGACLTIKGIFIAIKGINQGSRWPMAVNYRH
jgi:hypothetical protein